MACSNTLSIYDIILLSSITKAQLRTKSQTMAKFNYTKSSVRSAAERGRERKEKKLEAVIGQLSRERVITWLVSFISARNDMSYCLRWFFSAVFLAAEEELAKRIHHRRSNRRKKKLQSSQTDGAPTAAGNSLFSKLVQNCVQPTLPWKKRRPSAKEEKTYSVAPATGEISVFNCESRQAGRQTTSLFAHSNC